MDNNSKEGNAACHKRKIGDDGRLYCTIGVTEYYQERHDHKTTAVFCINCEFGIAARVVKCPYLDGTVTFIEMGEDYFWASTVSFYCLKKQEKIRNPRVCLACTIRDDADFALPTLETATLLESVGCGEAAVFLRQALGLLNVHGRTQKQNETVVNKTSNALAAGLKFLLIKYQKPTRKSNIKELWDEYKKASKYVADANRFYFITDELMQKIQLIRHKESDAHPSDRTPTDGETFFFLTLVSAIIHYLVRKAAEEGKL